MAKIRASIKVQIGGGIWDACSEALRIAELLDVNVKIKFCGFKYTIKPGDDINVYIDQHHDRVDHGEIK